MKTRVVEALYKISTSTEMPLVGNMIAQELSISQAELKRRAGIVLSNILHHYSDFSIGTIDSFTHKIVKTFAHDLKLPVNFNVELDIQSFYDKVISQLLNLVGEDPFVSQLLKEYVLNKAEDNASWDPEKQIREFSRLLQKEEAPEHISKLEKFSTEELSGFRKQFIEFIQYYKEHLKTLAQKAIDLIRSQQLTDDDFNYKKTGPQSFFKKCISGDVSPDDTRGARITDALTNNKWAGKTSPESIRKIESISGELTRITTELTEFIESHYRYYSLCSLLSRQMVPLLLLKKIEEISQQQKQEDRLVFISEFNQKIFDIINNEPTPFIYERLGERYQHYLLDEFQDTSSLQWHNILPLLDNSLGNGWFNLLVGDGKQSIYRWRNANVQQFADLPAVQNASQSAVTRERADTLRRNFKEQVLNTNFRSLKNIVDFNNSLFSHLSHDLLSENYSSIYRDQHQESNGQLAGCITVDTGKLEKDLVDEQTTALVKKRIESALASGYLYRDICILARKNTHGNTIASFLVENKIPVVSSDSLLLKNNLEINTIIAYLKYLNNRQDNISAATVLNYLFQVKRISEEQLHQYLSQVVSHISLMKIFTDIGISAPEQPDLTTLFDNCIYISKALGMEERAYHYVRFFLDEVNEFMVSKNGSTAYFFEWWESRSDKASMIIPDTTNAVRIMTIHASKGLEFPVVIIPYCNWAVYRSTDSWVKIQDEKVKLPVSVINLSKKVSESGFGSELEKEEQEQVLDNLNLLYVAFTRASERLHVITVGSQFSRGTTVADWLEDFMSKNHEQKDLTFQVGTLENKQGVHKEKLPDVFALDPLKFETDPGAIRIKSSRLHNHPEVEDARQQGLLLHELMSHIKHKNDIEPTLENAQLSGLLHRDQREILREKITGITQHKSLAPYFQPGLVSKDEAELVTANGEVLRPDRIVFTENETVIIDYKTGHENNKKYFAQLDHYAQALATMGYKKIKKLLVYIDGPGVIEVN